MSRVIILVLDGDLASGINVTLKQGRLLDDAVAITSQTLGKLRANPELSQLYRDWQKNYLRLEEICRTCRLPHRLELEDAPEGIPPDYKPTRQHCAQRAEEVCQNMNDWLNSATDGFEDIRHKLAEQFQHPQIRFLVETKDSQLQRLPWHLWSVCQDRQIEVTLSPRQYPQLATQSWGKSIRILAILGNSQGINIQTDKSHLQEMAKSWSDSCFLEQPSRSELENKLRDKEGWDILFFAGHSKSDRAGERGKIYINASESLSLEELRNAFNAAIQSRLKLAIFNSCDGLGLANELLKFNIPQTIVMREAIPDEVAHLFLAFFLEEFGENQPIDRAVRVARERLESIEEKLPYATWLPIIHQHPGAKNWAIEPEPEANQKTLKPMKLYLLLFSILGLIALITFFRYSRSHKISQTCPMVLNDRISCGEETVVTAFSTPLKERAVQAFSESNWQEALTGFENFWKSDRKDPETLIYWNNALLELTNSEYYTIAVIVPTRRDDRDSIVDSDLAEELLRGVAQFQTEVNLGLNSQWELPGRSFLEGKAIKGKGLRVVIVDDANQLNTVKSLANSLVQQSEILGVIGPYFSEVGTEIIDIFNRNKLVLLSPSNKAQVLTKPEPDYYFRAVTQTHIEAEKIADYLLEKGKKKIVLYYNPQNLSTHSFRSDFKDYFTERGGQVLEEVSIAQSRSNFNAEATIPNIDNPEEFALVEAPTSSPVNDSIANAIAVLQANQDRHLIVGTWGLYSRQTLEIARQLPSFKNLVIVGTWHPLNSPNKTFPEESKQLWGGLVHNRTALAYDAAKALARAIELQEKPTREGVRQILASPDFKVEGATGTVEFDRLGDRTNLPAQLFHIISCPKEKYGVTFAPIQIDTAAAAGLQCN